MTKRVDLSIRQGETFTRIIRWETAPRVWKAITAVTKAAPVVITAAGHGIVDGWRVGVVNVGGMTELNAAHNPPWDGELLAATYVDVDRIALNDVSAADFTTYTSGGYLMYWTPHSLAGYTARMKIKDRVGGSLLYTVTGFVLDDAGKAINMTITATDTTAMTFLRGVYDLEMVDGSGIVTTILSGNIEVQREVTT